MVVAGAGDSPVVSGHSDVVSSEGLVRGSAAGLVTLGLEPVGVDGAVHGEVAQTSGGVDLLHSDAQGRLRDCAFNNKIVCFVGIGEVLFIKKCIDSIVLSCQIFYAQRTI